MGSQKGDSRKIPVKQTFNTDILTSLSLDMYSLDNIALFYQLHAKEEYSQHCLQTDNFILL